LTKVSMVSLVLSPFYNNYITTYSGVCQIIILWLCIIFDIYMNDIIMDREWNMKNKFKNIILNMND